jgi:hypothetical protein
MEEEVLMRENRRRRELTYKRDRRVMSYFAGLKTSFIISSLFFIWELGPSSIMMKAIKTTEYFKHSATTSTI